MQLVANVGVQSSLREESFVLNNRLASRALELIQKEDIQRRSFKPAVFLLALLYVPSSAASVDLEKGSAIYSPNSQEPPSTNSVDRVVYTMTTGSTHLFSNSFHSCLVTGT